MDNTEALRVVQDVLNRFKAIQRIAEVLDNVVGAEVRLAELKKEQEVVVAASGALRGEMADVGAALNAAKKEFEDVKAAQKVNLQAGEADIAARMEAGGIELDGILAATEGAKVAYAKVVDDAEAKVNALVVLADKEEKRLAKVQKKVEELKKL